MTYYCESDLNFLAHHGVKGMRWGRRKSYNHNEALKSYGRSRGLSDKDMSKMRRGSIKRIGRHVDKGMNLKDARNREAKRKVVGSVAGSVATVGALAIVGKATMNSIKSGRMKSFGRSVTENVMTKLGHTDIRWLN